MFKNLHRELLSCNTPFAHAAICALVIGFGSVLAIMTDLFWVLGDMYQQIHPHHYVVLLGLSVSLGITIASYLWLYRAIDLFLVKRAKKVKKRVKKEAGSGPRARYREQASRGSDEAVLNRSMDRW